MRARLQEGCGNSSEVVQQLAGWLSAHPEIQCIASFAALDGEVDLADLVNQPGAKTWAFPRVVGDSLVFSAVTDPQKQLVVGAFGILEPRADLPPLPVDQIDGFLCPGLAFDLAGGRLGRGRGYYDRVLARARYGAVKLGVCFAAQIVPDTHPEPHDVLMDHVVTEFGLMV